MNSFYRVIRNILALFVGGFVVMFLFAGLSSERPMSDKLGAVGLVVAFLALLGWWPMTVARRKNLGSQE